MIAYLLKSILCSALLYGYYHVALRNKVFHQWNRFYLLAIVPLSLLLPLVRIRLEATPEAVSETPMRLLEVVSDGNERMEAVQLGTATTFDWSTVLYGIYALIGLLLLLHFARGLLRLHALSRRYPVHSADGVELVLAPVAGTPFSFFRRIFWNPELDLASESGQQILQHELVHVREGHTFDKLLLQAALALCWFNPVFWLLRNELHLVHEFIADERSVKNRDAGVLARLILQAAYPQQYSHLTNPFFHHAIKRRLHMLNQLKQNTRVRYLGRVLALPLLAGIGFAFAVRTGAKAQAPVTQTNESKFTVVIDAGHGRMENGAWNGASFGGVSEDEITLAIALKISELNADPNLKIIQTRGDEKIVPLRVRPVVAQGADLFLSLHVNASAEDASGMKPTTKWSGFSVLLSRDSTRFNQSRVIGSAILGALSGIYTTDAKLQSRKQGVWVIDQAPCPAALLELGYINNEKDRAFIQSPANQERIAKKILNAIARYRQRLDSTAVSQAPAPKGVPGAGIAADDTGTLRQKIAFVDARLAALRKELKDAGHREMTEELIRFLEDKKRELQTQLRDEAAGNPIKRLDVKPDGTVIAMHADGTRERLSHKAAESRQGISISGDRIATDAQKGTAEATTIDPATDPMLQALTGPTRTLTLEELVQTPVEKLLCPEGETLESAVYSTDLNNRDVFEVPVTDGRISPKIGESLPQVLRGGTIIVEKRIARTKNGEFKKLPALAYHIK
ncbi:N-acetylmuramoyl-L-alanine amidase [Flaviaesturariibacter flavus]|uniref:N-acetylmuramoyl-L-alanine amidase n=1 Tax=Flaviaesturariibacter flavus TaxID=2502780 RepID=A0A4R1B9G9_9BACT|nr:N-acetylmuramoyl-L-alanine amidase [Flaviaesturariibacter flavus]TCJ13555.1 N-acetylmuramoyl-L-alanine amidase [Flaviaesturariibacter flavus]